VILPKVRDPRFITVRRGGTLSDQDHHLLALWAAACAEHVLDRFELAQPNDPRPRRAIEHARAWVRGDITMTQARAAGGHAMGAARELRGAARHAAYAAGQAGAVAHVAAHELGAARLCHQGHARCRAGGRQRVRRAARVPVAARQAAGGDSGARPRRPAATERHLLVGIRLLTVQEAQATQRRRTRPLPRPG